MLSLGVALVAWPLAWLLLAVAQGVGVVACGGGFIGVSLPLGQHPWALVNQPEVNFASTRAGLWGYWLPPALLAALLAVGLPVLGLAPRRWGGELLVLHLAFAAAVLGLGWAPALGVQDGPARGLERFFHVPWPWFVGMCALAGALLSPLAMIRLAGSLWHHSSELTRRRRLAVVAVHGAIPAAAWIGLSFLVGWRTGPAPLLGAGVVLLGAVLTLLWRVPRASLHRREAPSAARTALVWPLAVAILAGAVLVGAPREGAPRGYVWGKPLTTNNIRMTWQITPLRAGLVRPDQKERGWIP